MKPVHHRNTGAQFRKALRVGDSKTIIVMSNTTPPNLENYVGNAFNAKQANFLSERVFKLTYEKKQKVNWNGEERSVPDQVNATPSTKSIIQKSSVLMSNKSEYDRMFSASIGAEYSGVTYSGSANSSLMYHGNLFADSSSSYALNMYTQSIFSFERLTLHAEDLDEGFVTALKGLPETIDTAAKKKKYFEFFDSYGTHYSHLANMGGLVVMSTKVENSLRRSASEREVTLAITAGYDGVVHKGKLSAESAYSSSDFLEQNREQVAIDITVEGGVFSDGESIGKWKETLYQTPIFLLNTPLANGSVSQLKSIADLTSLAGLKEVISDNIKDMIKEYVIVEDFVDGILGTPHPIDFGTVDFDKLGDGFLIGQIRAAENGERGYSDAMADPGQNPSTLRACASQHYYTDSDKWVPYASFVIPTPLNDSSTATKIPTSGNPFYTLYHVGMGNIDNSSFGTFESISKMSTPIIKSVDGFVIGYIDASNENGARGVISGKMKIEGELETVAGSSVHYYSDSDVHVPKNSFCMPVPANTEFQIDFNPTSGNPLTGFFFVPFESKDIILGAPKLREVNLKFQAEEDGLLMSLLDTRSADGGRSQITLYNNNSKDDLTNYPIASTSVHYYSGSDTWVPVNSAMIPISKNSHYSMDYLATSGNPLVSAHWIPIIRKT